MKITLYDVELGQCAMIECPNGRKVLVDCGHNTSRQWYPSEEFSNQLIDRLIISNFDEDHLSDLADVKNHCRLQNIVWNGSVSSSALRRMKSDGMREGVQNFHDFLTEVENGRGTPAVLSDLGDVLITTYCNRYGTFIDTNNLSLVTLVRYNNFSILFPGDITGVGMRALLANDDQFKRDTSCIDILVAPHHGRRDGQCDGFFENERKPQVVLLSDDGIEHATQEESHWYANRARGCITVAGALRNVITTRRGGHIFVEVGNNGCWTITNEAERTARLLVQQ